MNTKSRRAEDSNEIIAEMAKQRNMTLSRFALEAGITPSTLGSAKLRGRGPSKEIIQKICDAYGMTMADFYAGTTLPEGQTDGTVTALPEGQTAFTDTVLPAGQTSDTLALLSTGQADGTAAAQDTDPSRALPAATDADRIKMIEYCTVCPDTEIALLMEFIRRYKKKG